jgi:hypothetical protein
MTKLAWGSPGLRLFETGLDLGVLYLQDGSGVAWPGMVSLNENPTGGEAKPFYMDGEKYLNLSTAEEFEATLSAYSSPNEFSTFDGWVPLQNGLFATQQKRSSFGLSYRTLIGNDIKGSEFGYRIHLIYNALTSPATISNKTLSNSVEATMTDRRITVLPPSVSGLRPTAHLIIDSRFTPDALMDTVQDIIYGSDAAPSRQPSQQELINLFTAG